MKTFSQYFGYTILFCVSAFTARAQLDTLLRQVHSISDSTKSLEAAVLQRLDSTKALRLASGAQDTAAFYQQKIDSVSNWVNGRVAGLKNEYADQAGKITSVQNKLQLKLDSLTRLSLPNNEVIAKLDSLEQKLGGLQQAFQTSLSETKNKAVQKLNSIKFPPELKTHVSELQTNITQIIPDQLPGNLSFDVPGLDHLTTNLPSLPTLTPSSDLSNSINLPSGSALPTTPINTPSQNLQIPNTEELPQLSRVTAVTDKADGTINNLKGLQEQPIDKLAESKLAGVTGVKEIQNQTQIEGVGALQSEKALKAEMERRVRAVAVDHFSEKQVQLKAAMEKIAKYKQKYGEISSVADLSKKPKDPVKEKSFYERVLPGVNFQVLKKGDDILLDVNPYIGYKVSRRFTAGAGWNQRMGYNWEQKSFNSNARIFGPRAFGEYNLTKGFSPRLEIEVMNTLVPPATVTHGDPYERRWVAGAFAGVKKQYKISGQLRGTASVMFRLFDRYRQSPYGDVVNARFGLEYTPKRRNDKRKT
ncbi:MAG TPA: hypothetical protein VK658_15655 [Chryseolinea sp.]|nr:hypothetical protein [Chryseolinea sp.]